ncbi:MAG: hypothetical protein D6705_08875 [Deltaproteobacteria bacterium]|nr:MAG: hypothetical protein D6705_08875 [Deltaproteobacteria bacterium]
MNSNMIIVFIIFRSGTMRTDFSTLALLLPLSTLPACADDDALPTASEAKAAAAERTDGTPGDAERVREDGHDLWEVTVTMPNGASLEVLLFAESGDLFEIEDQAGPFDYALDPLPGQLTYAEAAAVAHGVVDGVRVAWEVKYDDGPYFYEFYIEDADAQLWEVKLWAEDGEVFATEPKDAVD